MYLVEDLYKRHGEKLGLELITGQESMKRGIKVPEAYRPGLPLAGYLKNHGSKRILIFGKVEIKYLQSLNPSKRIERLEKVLTVSTPAVIVARGYRPPKEIDDLCSQFKIPLFRTKMTTMNLLSKLTLLLTQEFAPSKSYHGTLVEVFGVGVMIQGGSSVGKSEAALGLLEKGHRLISDDVVHVRRLEDNYLEGYGDDITRHHMEIRGIGIINVAHLYGAICVRDHKSIDILVKLVVWDDNAYYDRIGLDETYEDMLGVSIPCHTLPVKPGRDVVLLLETIARNHRLKGMGYNSAKEFSENLLEMTSGKRGLKKMTQFF